jgi:glycine cleavage system aminomethyltransferase T/NADPH-dependent 2,4-dienoyl-CoA reductase/sulfur reductase-like enzyme
MRRLKTGGDIDRDRPVRIRFDGRDFDAFHGDSLASALLANGVCLVGRSFKYHRPRGFIAAGAEEPNGLFSVGTGMARMPNQQATMVEAVDGLVAESQNRWPSLRFDILSINQALARFLGAGFYYKTFMGRDIGTWMRFERLIRRSAGLGRPPAGPAAVASQTSHKTADVLVVGAGRAGLEAALKAAEKGKRVLVVERDSLVGGRARSTPVGSVDRDAVDDLMRRLNAFETVAIRTRATVFGAYDHGIYGIHEMGSRPGLSIVRAAKAVMATGAYERMIAFPGNDRPGVMLTNAVRTYLNRFGVLCGEQVVVFTQNDTAFDTAVDLAKAGAAVTLVDARAAIHPEDETHLTDAGVEVLKNARIVAARGRSRVRGVRISRNGQSFDLACDLVCVSGGWSPALHLSCHRGARPEWSDEDLSFQPALSEPDLDAAGAAAGGAPEAAKMPPAPIWSSGKPAAAFVDFQNDVTVKDIHQAFDEGYRSVEHLKRYTTLGMGTDQGKTSNVNGLAIMAGCAGLPIRSVGTTTFRPPESPVPLGVLAGAEVGARFHMVRRSPLDEAVREDGAVMTASGLWSRAWYFTGHGRDVDEAYIKEMEIVRTRAAITDLSTLGKIDVIGPDAAEFLNRVYVNGWSSLAVGRARWGIMLRDDGYVFDDGTTSRITDGHYFMTTTTANAGRVLARLEFLLQTAWVDLRVHVTSVTDQWAAIALAGPHARTVLARVADDIDVGDGALPFMGVVHGTMAGCPVRILRVSFTGEQSYEIYTPARDGAAVWRSLRGAGADTFGLEALGALRIEKGHVAANEMDGRRTLDDLGLGRMASKKKPFVGSVLMHRDGLNRPERQHLVGLESLDGCPLSTGSVLSVGPISGIGDGRITSATWSPSLGRFIALGLLKEGRDCHGDTVTVHNPARGITAMARVRDPHFLDPDGERMRG